MEEADGGEVGAGTHVEPVGGEGGDAEQVALGAEHRVHATVDVQVEHPGARDKVADLLLVVRVLVEELRPRRGRCGSPLVGINRMQLRDIDQPVGTLSGGERQSVAIARAVYFGAKVLILDEPTSALGVRQSGVVLRYIRAAAERGLGVIFITHNPHHKSEIKLEELTRLMAGGAELEALQHELGAR